MKKIITLIMFFGFITFGFAEDLSSFNQVIKDFITKGEYINYHFMGLRDLNCYIIRDNISFIDYSNKNGRLEIKTNNGEKIEIFVTDCPYVVEDNNIIFLPTVND